MGVVNRYSMTKRSAGTYNALYDCGECVGVVCIHTYMHMYTHADMCTCTCMIEIAKEQNFVHFSECSCLAESKTAATDYIELK